MQGGLDFPLVEAFVAVAEHANLTRTARQLHCVASNVSARIKQLETSLGGELFVRQRTGMLLTPKGERLIPLARDLMARRDALVNEMRNLGQSGLLAIGTPETFLRVRLASALAKVRTAYPETEVICRLGFSDAIQTLIQRREVDLGVTIGTSPPPNLEVLHRWSDRLVAVLPKGRTATSKKALAALRPLHLGEACFFGRSLQRYLDRRGLSMNLQDRVNSLETIMTLTEMGLGFSVLPRSFLEQHPRRRAVSLSEVRRQRDFSYFMLAKGDTVLSAPAKSLLSRIPV